VHAPGRAASRACLTEDFNALGASASPAHSRRLEAIERPLQRLGCARLRSGTPRLASATPATRGPRAMARMPRTFSRPRQPQACVCFITRAARLAEAQRDPDIVQIGLQPVQPGDLLGTRSLGSAAPLAERRSAGGGREALGFGGGVKFFARVLAHCFQQVVARVLAWAAVAMTMDCSPARTAVQNILLVDSSGRPPMDEYLPVSDPLQSDNQSRRFRSLERANRREDRQALQRSRSASLSSS